LFFLPLFILGFEVLGILMRIVGLQVLVSRLVRSPHLVVVVILVLPPGVLETVVRKFLSPNEFEVVIPLFMVLVVVLLLAPPHVEVVFLEVQLAIMLLS
jgi:hypothetical protein